MFEKIDGNFSVCKVGSLDGVAVNQPFTFISVTDNEISVVLRTENAPQVTTAREDGWRAMRVKGNLEFSLIGIIADISAKLAANGISVFVVSTYDTDYVLVKAEKFERAWNILN